MGGAQRSPSRHHVAMLACPNVTRYRRNFIAGRGSFFERRRTFSKVMGFARAQPHLRARILTLATPSAGTAAQQSAINQIVQYGASRGVTVNPIIFP